MVVIPKDLCLIIDQRNASTEPLSFRGAYAVTQGSSGFSSALSSQRSRASR